MSTRHFAGTFAGVVSLSSFVLLAPACHARAGGPVLPAVDSTAASAGVYGAAGGRDAAGQTTVVSGEKLMEGSPRTVTDMLVGRFPGVEVFKTANGGTSIRIRGARSFNSSNEPLFVLDGYPQHNGNASLQDLDPHDIKSIQVLKGAEASSYGSRGAGGVILITTKKGSQ